MHNNQSSYAFWSWLIALALGITLLLMYLTGNGPSNHCCTDADQSSITAQKSPIESEPVVTETFSFSATETEFNGNGDATNITWISDIDALKALLSGNFTAEGDASTITLSGEVDSEEAKIEIETNAQAFFGPDVVINNMVTVSPPVVIETPPDVAKLYFETGVHSLPTDAENVLAASIAWLNNHPETKVIISGFHDVTGNFEMNQMLAKKRAQSAYDALIVAGISADRIEMRKPESTEGDGDLSEARRVEVTIE